MAAPRKKRGYHHGDLRAALLDAALRIVEKDGPAALTLREVGRRVGVSQAAPYHHFEDKESILAALAEEGFDALTESMEVARAGAGKSPRARLRACGIGYVRFAVRHPAHFTVVFAGETPHARFPKLHAAGERAFGVVLETVKEGQESGLLRDGPAIELAVLSWAMVHGLAMLHVKGIVDKPGGPPGTIEHLAEAAAEAIVRGLEK